jgi:AcrR family transcriptional regulator
MRRPRGIEAAEVGGGAVGSGRLQGTDRREQQQQGTDRRAQILGAALAIADEQGLDAVTMRAVAARIGLTAMAIYPHVSLDAEFEADLDDLVGLVENLASA